MVWTVKPDKMEISPLKAYFMMIKAGYKFYRICQLDRMKENEIFSFTGAAIIKLANVSLLISWYAHSLHSLTLCPSFSFPCFGPLSFLFFFFPSLPFSLTVTLSDSCISPALTLTGPQATAGWLSHLSVSTINSPQFRLPKTEWFYFCLHDC